MNHRSSHRDVLPRGGRGPTSHVAGARGRAAGRQGNVGKVGFPHSFSISLYGADRLQSWPVERLNRSLGGPGPGDLTVVRSPPCVTPPLLHPSWSRSTALARTMPVGGVDASGMTGGSSRRAAPRGPPRPWGISSGDVHPPRPLQSRRRGRTHRRRRGGAAAPAPGGGASFNDGTPLAVGHDSLSAQAARVVAHRPPGRAGRSDDVLCPASPRSAGSFRGRREGAARVATLWKHLG
jgi:hypothetical protein